MSRSPLPARSSRRAPATRVLARAAALVGERHPPAVEAAAVLGAFALYESTRGLVAGGATAALRHTHDVVALERTLHLFDERTIQQGAASIPGLTGALCVAYLTLHLATTVAVLLWLHRRRPDAYPFVRTTLVLASLLALTGYILFPTAPPRLGGLGFVDTVTRSTPVDLNRGLVSSLYDPYAAMPSMHAGYALIVGTALARHGRRLVTRAAGLAYPFLVVLMIVATGNHFLLDAAAGLLLAAVAAATTASVLRLPRLLRVER